MRAQISEHHLFILFREYCWSKCVSGIPTIGKSDQFRHTKGFVPRLRCRVSSSSLVLFTYYIPLQRYIVYIVYSSIDITSVLIYPCNSWTATGRAKYIGPAICERTPTPPSPNSNIYEHTLFIRSRSRINRRIIKHNAGRNKNSACSSSVKGNVRNHNKNLRRRRLFIPGHRFPRRQSSGICGC